MNFSDVSFKKKILVLLALPMIGFLWLSVSSISNSISTAKEMTTLTALTKLSVVYSELVHELQKERGMTAGFIGSNGEQFASQLNNQRAATNQKLEQRKNHWLINEFDQQEIKQLNTSINQDLNQLEKIRGQVDAQSINISQAITYYTQLNEKLLSVSGLIAEISSDALITKQVIAYYNFLQGKERAGIERAVLSNTFAKDKFESGVLIKFIALLTEQDTYFANFNAFSNQESKAFFAQQLSDSSVEEVKKIREIAKTKIGQFNVDPEYWFAQATGRIDQLKKTENKLEADLLKFARDAKDTAFNSMLFNVIFSTLLIIVALVISFYTVKELASRVRDLTSVMARVRDNNDLTVKTQLLGESELGKLSSGLNLTLSKFSVAISEISNSSIALASAAEQTSQTCEYNSTSMLDQQDQISLIATAVEELSATVKEVANNTQHTAISAREADEQTQNGLDVVKQSYHSIESLAVEIDGLAQRINNLHDSSQNITNVVDVIKSVADQTNLLALNAAIEAARAGEQGRGFAVVADEVRTLAQRTQDSTAEIENFITTLQSDATAAFNVIETSQTKAAEAVNHSKNVENTLGDITEAVSNIFAMTEQVAAAIEEQAVVTKDIAQNIVGVEQKSMESTTGATQIAATAKEQAQLAVTLQDIASSFKI